MRQSRRQLRASAERRVAWRDRDPPAAAAAAAESSPFWLVAELAATANWVASQPFNSDEGQMTKRAE